MDKSLSPDSSESERFISTMRRLGGNSVLLKQNDGGAPRAVFVSEKFADMIECTAAQAEEIISGGGFNSFVHENDRSALRNMLRSRKNDDGGTELILRLRTAKGHSIQCSLNFAFLDENDGNYIYITFFDITVMKEYEERLKGAYMSLGDTFFRSSSKALGMFRVNLTRNVIEYLQGRDLYETDSTDSSYSEVLGYRAERCPIAEDGEKLLSIFGKDNLISDYLNGRMHENVIVYSMRPDGRKCFVKMSANLTRHPVTGDVTAFITETESNSQKVNETLIDKILVRQFDMVACISNNRYRVILGDASLIKKGSIFPKTDEGGYENYLRSQVIPVLSGTDEEKAAMEASLSLETIGRKLSEHEPYTAAIACEIDGDIYYKRFDFFTVDPRAEFCILLKSDTTAVHKEQAQRNEHLRLALHTAEQANKAKTAFLSRMSHEIRTPMNAIIGLDNIALQEPELSAETREHLEKIGSSARYLLTLINDILDMSRIESGKMTLKKEEFSFRSFLDQVNTLADSQCRERGLKYDCTVEGKIDEFYIGDNTKLKQVLINILGNSVKFTDPPGEVTLSVECISRSEQHSAFRFTIKDTGVGMDKEYLPRIFDAFSQEDASNTSKYGGSGLGLAITKNIVDIMNGSISVDSEKGKGSVFTVEVTLRNTDRVGLVPSGMDIEPKDLTVLIIDDDPDACRHDEIVLEEIGIKCECCLSGDDALERLKLKHARRKKFDMILVDYRMPAENGIEVTRKIRGLIGDETAVIMVTAYSWQDIEKQAEEAGVDGFVAKPLFAAGILGEYRDVLTRKWLRSSEKKMTDLNGKRILVAEDVMINAQIMMRILSIKGMTAEHAENGRIAVDMFAKSENGYYDAVLMDVRMPEMDGLQAASAIRALDRADSRTVPIIAMTANAFDEDVQLSLRAGMNAHLSKPVEADLLYSTLSELITSE